MQPSILTAYKPVYQRIPKKSKYRTTSERTDLPSTSRQSSSSSFIIFWSSDRGYIIHFIALCYCAFIVYIQSKCGQVQIFVTLKRFRGL